MLFAITCIDKPGALEIRKTNRDAHLEHIKSSSGAVVEAGPFLDAAGNMCGSLIIYQAESMDDAQKWADGDPYKAANLFASVEIRAWNRVVGN